VVRAACGCRDGSERSDSGQDDELRPLLDHDPSRSESGVRVTLPRTYTGRGAVVNAA